MVMNRDSYANDIAYAIKGDGHAEVKKRAFVAAVINAGSQKLEMKPDELAEAVSQAQPSPECNTDGAIQNLKTAIAIKNKTMFAQAVVDIAANSLGMQPGDLAEAIRNREGPEYIVGDHTQRVTPDILNDERFIPGAHY